MMILVRTVSDSVFYGNVKKNHLRRRNGRNSQANRSVAGVAVTSGILYRYLLRECVKTWASVIGVLMVLTMGMGFARFISRAAAGEMPADVVFAVAGYSALQNLEIVLPVSLLLSILLVVGRLCHDNEMPAMAAGGMGLARLYRPFLTFALLLAIAAAVLSMRIGPEAGRAIERLQGDNAASLATLEAGRFHTLLDGRAVFYAEAVDTATDRMHDVFIRVRERGGESGNAGRETVVVAKRAWQRRESDGRGRTLVLLNGRRYEGVPGRSDYRIVHFAEHGVHIVPEASDPDFDLDEVDTSDLWAYNAPGVRAELQQRLSVPVLVLVLAFLAVPLGHVPPRAGRYGRLVVGILLYVGYANLLRLAEAWFVQGVTLPILGLWWVHVSGLMLTTALIAYRQGRLRPPRWRRLAWT